MSEAGVNGHPAIISGPPSPAQDALIELDSFKTNPPLVIPAMDPVGDHSVGNIKQEKNVCQESEESGTVAENASAADMETLDTDAHLLTIPQSQAASDQSPPALTLDENNEKNPEFDSFKTDPKRDIPAMKTVANINQENYIYGEPEESNPAAESTRDTGKPDSDDLSSTTPHSQASSVYTPPAPAPDKNDEERSPENLLEQAEHASEEAKDSQATAGKGPSEKLHEPSDASQSREESSLDVSLASPLSPPTLSTIDSPPSPHTPPTVASPPSPPTPPPAAQDDDSGCEVEPEPPALPAGGMSEPTGPDMADVESLARSVVSDTLQRAKQDAQLQRRLEHGDKPEADCDPEGWLDVVGNGQLKKKVLTAGTGGRESRPKRSELATVRLQARLDDDTPVTHGVPERLTFGVGDGEVVTGLDMAVGLMQPGETADVYMDARFAYGDCGLEDSVPAGGAVTFTVNLERVEPAPKYEDMSAQQRLEIGSEKRDRGNWWFKREDYNHAIQCYRRALDFFDNESDDFTGLPDDVHILFEERLKVHNNLAAAQMKLEAHEAALRSLQLVLTCQPHNVKALFRKAKVLSAQGQVPEAVAACRLALKHSPDNKTVQVELARLTALERKAAEEQKSLYRKMLGLPPGDPQPAADDKSKGFPMRLVVLGVACAVAAVAVHRLRLLF